jgi:hypothetical protein
MKIFPLLKKTIYLFLLLPVTSFAQEKNVIIRVVQDVSYRLDDFQTSIRLKKKNFKFQVLLNNVEGVYVFASLKDSIYRFTETSPIRDFSYLKLLELREEDKFNSNKELSISEDGWSYWFYNDSTEYHSFSRKTVHLAEKGKVCTKVIKELYDVANGRVVKLKNLTTPLYLFFVVVSEYDSNGVPTKELMRRKLRIEWEEDD